MKNFKLTGKIQNGKIDYFENNMSNYNQFKADNEGKNVDVTIEIMDRPEYYQHKYYRGGLLPAIAEASGEHNVHIQHILLKYDFLFRKEEIPSNIPKKYYTHGIYTIHEHRFNNVMLFKIPCKYIKGIMMVLKLYDSGLEKLIGYIPSTADLTYDEMKQYIKQCENRLFIDLNGSLSEYWGKYKNDNL